MHNFGEGWRVAQPTPDDGQPTKKKKWEKRLATVCFIYLSFRESKEIFNYHSLKLNLNHYRFSEKVFDEQIFKVRTFIWRTSISHLSLQKLFNLQLQLFLWFIFCYKFEFNFNQAKQSGHHCIIDELKIPPVMQSSPIQIEKLECAEI